MYNFSSLFQYRYVQDQIKANGKELANLIYNRNAIVYVCGDIRIIARDIRETIAHTLKEYYGQLKLVINRNRDDLLFRYRKY